MVLRRVSGTAAAALAVSVVVLGGVPVRASDPVPTVGSCLQVVDDQVWQNDAPITIVPCGEVHNSDVYNVARYPDDVGKPSEIAGNAGGFFWRKCASVDLEEWLGRVAYAFPVRVFPVIRIPTDAQWEAGARWVACTASMPTGEGGASSYKGKLPSFMAKAPILDLLYCLNEPPQSGSANAKVACTSKSKWMFVSSGRSEGKVGPDYPRDLQAAANSQCAEWTKALLKPRAKLRPVAAFGPAEDFPTGNPEFECFIAVSSWNGKGR